MSYSNFKGDVCHSFHSKIKKYCNGAISRSRMSDTRLIPSYDNRNSCNRLVLRLIDRNKGKLVLYEELKNKFPPLPWISHKTRVHKILVVITHTVFRLHITFLTDVILVHLLIS